MISSSLEVDVECRLQQGVVVAKCRSTLLQILLTRLMLQSLLLQCLLFVTLTSCCFAFLPSTGYSHPRRLLPRVDSNIGSSCSSNRGTCFRVASELPENEEPNDTDSLSDDFDEKTQEDRELERRMARNLFDDLRGTDPLLTRDKFIKWEDIVELLSRGVFDGETLEVIYTECRVKGNDINFEQFLEIVDLVNQVAAVLDQDLQSILNSDMETEIIDDDTMEEDDNFGDLGLSASDLSWMPKSIQ